MRRTPVTAQQYPFNTGWVFGAYNGGSEQPGYQDAHLTPVSLPHCVTELSWQKWNPEAWEHVWLYRRTFDGTNLLKGRVLVDFDGVMVNATVVINGQTVATHMGGYLPFSAELTGYLEPGDNVLAVVVDARCLPVPPEGNPAHDRAPSTSCSRAGSTGTSGCGWCRAPICPTCSPGRSTCSPRTGVFMSGAPSTPARRRPRQYTTAALAKDGREIATVSRTLYGVPEEQSVTALSLTGLGEIQLWSPASPALYELTTTVFVPGTGTHSVRHRIGFREATLSAPTASS